MKGLLIAVLSGVGAFSCGAVQTYLGAAGALTLPQGGSHMRRIAGGVLRGGVYLDENLAVEGEAGCQEDACGLAVQGLVHFCELDLYSRFFGYSRFDPFLTFGARGWIGGEGQVGPKTGVGAFYHLTDSWSFRGEADVTLGLDGETAAVYTVAAGFQYSF